MVKSKIPDFSKFQPAITSVFPVNGTTKQKIKFLEKQISELKQQKICYNNMIKDRKEAIQKIIVIEEIKKRHEKIMKQVEKQKNKDKIRILKHVRKRI